MAVSAASGVFAFQKLSAPTLQTVSQQNYTAADYRYYEAKCLALTGAVVLKNGTDNPVSTNADQGEAEQGENDLNYCDLAAQYRAAQAGESTAFWSLIMTALTFFGVLMIGRTLAYTSEAVIQTKVATETAQAAVDETRRIGQTQLRAYLSIDFGNVVFASGRGECGSQIIEPRVRIAIRNTGSSPASLIEIRYGVSIIDPQPPFERPESNTVHSRDCTGDQINPSDTQTMTLQCQVKADFQALLDGRQRVRFSLSVRYQTVFDEIDVVYADGFYTDMTGVMADLMGAANDVYYGEVTRTSIPASQYIPADQPKS